MNDPWLNFQYMIEFASSNGFGKQNSGVCSVLSVNSQAITHGSSSYMVNPMRGEPIRKYVYGGTYTEPINVSILLGEGARPWLQWFSSIQTKGAADVRNVSLSLYSYGSSPNSDSGQLWLRWDLINCFPISWQIGSMSQDDSPSAMKIDMTLQFESMVILDGLNEMHEVMG